MLFALCLGRKTLQSWSMFPNINIPSHRASQTNNTTGITYSMLCSVYVRVFNYVCVEDRRSQVKCFFSNNKHWSTIFVLIWNHSPLLPLLPHLSIQLSLHTPSLPLSFSLFHLPLAPLAPLPFAQFSPSFPSFSSLLSHPCLPSSSSISPSQPLE